MNAIIREGLQDETDRWLLLNTNKYNCKNLSEQLLKHLFNKVLLHHSLF